MGYLRYAVDSSIRVFMRELNSLRLLIINAAVPIMVLSIYRALSGVFMGYVVGLVPEVGYYIRPIVINAVSFMNNIMYFIAVSSVIASIVASVFIINGLVRGWRDDLRAVYNLYRSRAGVFIYVITVLLLSSLYSYVIGVSISVSLALIVLKTLSSLRVLPLVSYSINVVGTVLAVLPLLAIMAVTYVIVGILGVVRRDLTP